MGFVVSAGTLVTTDRPLTQPYGYAVELSQYVTESYSQLYKAQPHVRTVISFLARNVAQLNLRVYERVSDTDRTRLTDHPLAVLIKTPNPWTTRYRMFQALMSDLGIYDNAYLLKVTAPQPAIVRLNPAKVVAVGASVLVPDSYLYYGVYEQRTFPASSIVHIHGYNPDDDRVGCSPLESLRRTLAEEYAAGEYRDQVLRNGGRFSGYITRPLDAPGWSDKAAARFKADWQAQYSGLGPQAGGTPILEDGMSWVAAGQTAEALQYIEARKLTREEVAAAYHIPPPLVGILDHATFSNITEQHKNLYQDTLGPWLKQIEEEVELQLLPDLDSSGRAIYVEFNLEAKLKGSFEEQAAQLQTAVGAPWLTRNEARARQNLSSLPGGDELITPLNVLVGGQASPTASGTQNVGGGLARTPPTKAARGLKAVARRAEHETTTAEVLRKFFGRQRAVVLSAIGALKAAQRRHGKAVPWWDDERWNRELSAELYDLAVQVSHTVARSVLDEIGLSPDAYDVDRTRAFLDAVATRVAGSINAVTQAQIDAALSGDDPATGVSAVFEQAQGARTAAAAATLVTTLAGFAVVESGRQAGGDGATKTWVTGHNPRPDHSRMNGQTVGMDEAFSNGANWPGDSSALGVDQIAGCNCSVSINIP